MCLYKHHTLHHTRINIMCGFVPYISCLSMISMSRAVSCLLSRRHSTAALRDSITILAWFCSNSSFKKTYPETLQSFLNKKLENSDLSKFITATVKFNTFFVFKIHNSKYKVLAIKRVTIFSNKITKGTWALPHLSPCHKERMLTIKYKSHFSNTKAHLWYHSPIKILICTISMSGLFTQPKRQGVKHF